MSDTLDLDARCISHPERPAARACARCGDFICSGCVVSIDLCSSCKSRLFREGVPYSEQEKARARARRYRRTGERLLKALLGLEELLPCPALQLLAWSNLSLSLA